MKRNPFTLVEILVVIAVIAILMGLLFPALGMVREKAYMRQSLSDVKAIHLAIKSFKNDYQYLPDRTTGSDTVYYGSKDKASATRTKEKCNDVYKSDAELKSDYKVLFSVLCYQKPGGSIPSDSGSDAIDKDPRELNPKKVKFLTPSSKYSKPAATQNGYRDPWGRPYLVFLDTDYDGKIEMPGSTDSNRIYVYDDVAVVGMGSFDPSSTSTLGDLLDDKNRSKIVTSWQ